MMMNSVGPIIVRVANSALERFHDYRRDGYVYNGQEFQESFQGENPNGSNETFGFLRWLQRILYTIFLGMVLLLLSLATYGLFFISVMPSPRTAEPLYFDYTCQLSSHTSTTTFDDGSCPTEPSSRSNKACMPLATVDIFSKHSSWESYHPDLLPPPKHHVLTPRKPYFLEIGLQLPETDTNRRVGMFGVETQLWTQNKTLLAKSVRSVRMPHESLWIAIVRKQLFLVPLLVGAMTESKSITVPAFRHYRESKLVPLHHVSVQLLPRSGVSWNNTSVVEVVAGDIRVGKELNTLQLVLKEWFWTCLVVGTSIIAVVEGFGLLVLRVVFLDWLEFRRQTLAQQQQQHQQDNDDERRRRGGEQGMMDGEGPYDDDEWDPMPSTDEEPEQSNDEPSLQQEHSTKDDDDDDPTGNPPLRQEPTDILQGQTPQTNDNDDDQWGPMLPEHPDLNDSQQRTVT